LKGGFREASGRAAGERSGAAGQQVVLEEQPQGKKRQQEEEQQRQLQGGSKGCCAEIGADGGQQGEERGAEASQARRRTGEEVRQEGGEERRGGEVRQEGRMRWLRFSEKWTHFRISLPHLTDSLLVLRLHISCRLAQEHLGWQKDVDRGGSNCLVCVLGCLIISSVKRLRDFGGV
jgi:hypothetical protein